MDRLRSTVTQINNLKLRDTNLDLAFAYGKRILNSELLKPDYLPGSKHTHKSGMHKRIRSKTDETGHKSMSG